LACEANSSGNPAELFPMPGCYTDSSVDQFMAQDRSHQHRHQLFRLTQVGPDKNLEMPILTALIIPASPICLLRRPLEVNSIAIRNWVGNGLPNRSNMGAIR